MIGACHAFDPVSASLAEIEDRIDEKARLLMTAVFKGHDVEREQYAVELADLRKIRFDRLTERDRQS